MCVCNRRRMIDLGFLRLARRKGLLAIGGMLLAFAALSSEVLEAERDGSELIGQLDRWVLSFANDHRSSAYTSTALNITALGSMLVLSIVVIFACIFLASRKQWMMAAQMVSSAAGAVALTVSLKLLFNRPRPELIFRAVEEHGLSYPSGHSLGAAAVYCSLYLILSKNTSRASFRFFLLLSFTLLIVSVGFSRVYLGVHYFSDVVAGIMVGLCWSVLISKILILREQKPVR